MALGDKKNVPWSVNGILSDAGGDIKVAAASIPTAGGASIETALSTKASWSGEILAGSALAWAETQTVPNGCASTGDMTDLPYAGAWMLSVELYQWSNWRKLIATDVVNGEEWQNILNSGTWTGWIPIATATPPQEHPLPLAAGYTAYTPCVYWRTQDGGVRTNIRLAAGAVTAGQTCAALPVGYRPGSLRSVIFTADLSAGGVVHGHADAVPDGTIRLYPAAPITSAASLILNPFVFIAAT